METHAAGCEVATAERVSTSVWLDSSAFPVLLGTLGCSDGASSGCAVGELWRSECCWCVSCSQQGLPGLGGVCAPWGRVCAPWGGICAPWGGGALNISSIYCKQCFSFGDECLRATSPTLMEEEPSLWGDLQSDCHIL